jgi:hypothetical protein
MPKGTYGSNPAIHPRPCVQVRKLAEGIPVRCHKLIPISEPVALCHLDFVLRGRLGAQQRPAHPLKVALPRLELLQARHRDLAHATRRAGTQSVAPVADGKGPPAGRKGRNRLSDLRRGRPQGRRRHSRDLGVPSTRPPRARSTFAQFPALGQPRPGVLDRRKVCTLPTTRTIPRGQIFLSTTGHES